ncbi:hypothetical protein ACHAWT_004235 [Skeletonema menzelii]
MPSKSPSPNDEGNNINNDDDPTVPSLPNLSTNFAMEGDWRQKLQLESNNFNVMMGGNNNMMLNHGFVGNANYFVGDTTTNATTATSVGGTVGMTNNDGNSTPAAAAAGAGEGGGNITQEQMEAELKRMQKENEELMKLISSRQQQQLGGGGSDFVTTATGVTNNDNMNSMMVPQKDGGAESDNHQLNKDGGINNSEGQSKSDTNGAAAVGMNTNPATAIMGGMMMGGMNNTMNMNMMMPYSTMMGGMNDMMSFNNNNSLMMPYSMGQPSMNNMSTSNNNTTTTSINNTTNNEDSLKLPSTRKHPPSTKLITMALDSNEDPNWEERYHELQLFKSQHGHTRVPARYKPNPKLGRWVMTQRRQFTVLMQGFPSALTTERMNRLNEIGFVWALRADPVTMWNRKFGELKAYKKLFGNCMVPQRYQPNPKLGTWVHTQRRQYKLMIDGKKSAMNNEKMAALDSIGFFWMAKQKDGGEIGGSAAAAAVPSLPPVGKSEGYGEEVDEDSGGED